MGPSKALRGTEVHRASSTSPTPDYGVENFAIYFNPFMTDHEVRYLTPGALHSPKTTMGNDL